MSENITDSETLQRYSASINSPGATSTEINTEETDDRLPSTLAAKRRLALLKKRKKPRKTREGFVPLALRFVNEVILTKCMESLTITVGQEQQPCDPSSKEALKTKSIYEILENAYGHDLLPTYFRKCSSAISGSISTQPYGGIRL